MVGDDESRPRRPPDFKLFPIGFSSAEQNFRSSTRSGTPYPHCFRSLSLNKPSFRWASKAWLPPS